MSTSDFFRARLDQMIDLRHPLAVLSQRLPWEQIVEALEPLFEHQDRPGREVARDDLFGPSMQVAGGGVSPRGRPRLPIRLMVSLLYLKHAEGLSDEAVVERWSQDVVWQYFSGMEYYEPKLPCDPTQLGRFRTHIGEAGVEELLKATMDTAVEIKAARPQEFERVVVDTTVQEKAVAFPVDSRLLEIAREKLVEAAKAERIELKQTYAKEGKKLRRKAGGYGHARQYRRLRRVLKRQRTILGRLLREVGRKATTIGDELAQVLERTERLHRQKPKDKNKLYALHAPEVECISKGKARQRYEFGVKASIAVTHKQGLIVGARTFPGNPYDGDTLAEQLEQSRILMEDIERAPKEVFVDLGYRAREDDNPGVEIIHRGKSKRITSRHRKALRRRQAVEPVIGHLKQDNGMGRCWLKGQTGDALHVVLCAAGYNLRWLMRKVTKMGLVALLWAWLQQLIRSIRLSIYPVNPALGTE